MKINVLLFVFGTAALMETSRCNAAPFSESKDCDMIADGAICLFGGSKVILPDAGVSGLLAHYDFDQDLVVDSSGNRNHANNENGIGVGPGIWGRGASASFQGVTYVDIPHSESLGNMGGSYTVSMWMFLPEAFSSGNGKFCPIVQKGTGDNAAPSLAINAKTRKLRVKTKVGGGGDGDVKSEARVGLSRWTHVAAVRSSDRLDLYVNGVKDVTTTALDAQGNDANFLIGAIEGGNDPDCEMSFFMDEVRVYSRALEEQEIIAEAVPSLGGYSPSSYRLGCADCAFPSNFKCDAGYSLCSEFEMYAGGYQFATMMGYASSGTTKFWTTKDIASTDTQGKGTYICCEES